MSQRVAYPFLVLQPASVLASEWKVAVGDTEMAEAGEWLADWDASIPVRLSRSVGVDFDRAADDLEMEVGQLHLTAALRIGTGSGRLPRAMITRERRLLTAEEPVTVFETIVDGSDLSSLIDLEVNLVLARDHFTGGDLSPRRAGDRVWSDTIRIRLEGEEPRLPIEVADLSSLLGGTAGHAPWYLDWSPHDWTRDFHGALRLYLNSSHRDLIARIEAEDAEILRGLMADVMGQVCEALVRDPDAAAIIESCGEGSLGAQAADWVRNAFSGRSTSHARALLEHRPGLFRASILALAEQQVEER